MIGTVFVCFTPFRKNPSCVPMIMNMNEKGRQTKLLAAFAIIAMVACVFAVVMPTDEVNGATITVDAETDLQTAIDDAASGDILNITADVTIDDTITINKNITITSSNSSTISRADSFHDGDMFDITTSGKLTLSGNVVIDGKGSFTPSSGESGRISSISSVTGRSQGVAFDIDGAMVIDGNVQIKNHINEEAVDSYIRGVVANVASTGSLEINGGTISDNLGIYAENATMIWVQGVIYSEGDLKITGGTITDNVLYAQWTANTDNIYYGAFGTIYAASGTITMTGGTISDNTLDGVGNVSSAGAINVGADVTSASIRGVTITGNYSSNGGALNLYADTTISNVTINNNLSETAADEYKDIYAGETGSVTFTGTNTIGYITLAGNSNSVSGTLTVAGLTNTGTLTNNGTITGTIDNTGTYNISTTTPITSSNIESIVFANANNVTLTSGTISGDITIPSGKTLIITDGVTMTPATEEDYVTVDVSIGSFGVDTDTSKSFALKTESNGSVVAQFDDIVGKMVVSKGSVDIGQAEINSGSATIIDEDVIITGIITGEFTLNMDLSAEKTITFGTDAENLLTIREGGSLQIVSTRAVNPTVSANPNLDIAGSISFDGAEASDTLTITKGSGVLNAYSTTSLNNVILSGASYDSGNRPFLFEGEMTQDQTVSTEQSLTGDLYIPYGYTLTIASGGVLNLNGYGIYVGGTLLVQANGAIKNIDTDSGTSVFGDGTIILHRNGVIDNSGTIGSGTPVKITAIVPDSSTLEGGKYDFSDLAVTYTAVGYIEVQDVTGVSVSVKSVSGTYYMHVTGNVYVSGMSAAYKLSTYGVYIEDELVIGDNVTFNAGSTVVSTTTYNTMVKSSATVTINGLMSGELWMLNNSTVVINGQVSGSVKAETGHDETVGFDAPGTTTVTFRGNGNGFVSGVTISVGQVTSMDNNVSYTDQILYISGTLDYNGTNNSPNATLAIVNTAGGESEVAADAILNVDDDVTVTGGNTVVNGQVIFSDNNVSGFYGTQYTIASQTSTDKTTYITNFEDAYGQIANAERTTIYVMGDLDIEIDVNLTSQQNLNLSSAGDVVVTVDAEVSVQSGGIITGTIDTVKGVVTYYNGYSATAPTNYVVYKQTTEYRQYSGLVPAIENAVSGDVIDVRFGDTVENDMTIPAGVTVNISSGAVLVFEEDLTVEETAKLDNKGEIQMVGEKSTITVYGELVSEEGTITYADTVTQGALYSTGTTTIGETNGDNLVIERGATVSVNAASYQDEDANIVLTSIAGAVAGVETMDTTTKQVYVSGTVNESGDITLGSSTVLIIGENARVSVDNIILTASSTIGQGSRVTVDSTGQLTATISGQTGVSDSTVSSAVDLTRASATVMMYSNISGSNVKTDYLMLGGTLEGTATVAEGTVNAAFAIASVISGLNVDGTTLTVAEGATLAVQDIGDNDVTITVGTNKEGASLVVDGTILFDGGDFAADDGIVTVNGTMTVADETEVNIAGALNITGTVNVSTTEDKEGVIIVGSGDVLTIGAKPTTLGVGGSASGAINIVDNGYIRAYSGADLTGALINYVDGESTAVSTTYNINGQAYMTVYAVENAVEIFTAINAETFEIAGYDMSNAKTANTSGTYNWFPNNDYTGTGISGTTMIGADGYENVYYYAPAVEKSFTVSVGVGISLYIDGVRILENSVDLTIGTYDVVAQVDPGYTGTVTITFNGQTVTSGTVTVTADMISDAYTGDRVITASGAISQDSTVVIDGGNQSGSDMGLTDYLLIILVILIVIMAIIVALRLMRS